MFHAKIGIWGQQGRGAAALDRRRELGLADGDVLLTNQLPPGVCGMGAVLSFDVPEPDAREIGAFVGREEIGCNIPMELLRKGDVVEDGGVVVLNPEMPTGRRVELLKQAVSLATAKQ
jgi:hypothetical protein